MKCSTASAMVLTWPGVPVTACASIRPLGSNTPAERSPASRTEVEKAVRSSVIACSSTTEISRFHITCMRMSRVASVMAQAPCGRSAAIRRPASRTSKGEVTTVDVSRSTITAGPATRAPGDKRGTLDDAGFERGTARRIEHQAARLGLHL